MPLLVIIQHPPPFCSTHMQEGRKEGRRGEYERGKQTLVLWRIFEPRGLGLRTHGRSVGNAGKIEPSHTLWELVLLFWECGVPSGRLDAETNGTWILEDLIFPGIGFMLVQPAPCFREKIVPTQVSLLGCAVCHIPLSVLSSHTTPTEPPGRWKLVNGN